MSIFYRPDAAQRPPRGNGGNREAMSIFFLSGRKEAKSRLGGVLNSLFRLAYWTPGCFYPLIDIISVSCDRKDQRAKRHCAERSDVAIPLPSLRTKRGNPGGLECSAPTGLFDLTTIPYGFLQWRQRERAGHGRWVEPGVSSPPWIATSLCYSQ